MTGKSYPRMLLLILAYNRPRSLIRLLDSLSKLAPPTHPVDLIISIDGDGDPQCIQQAGTFTWNSGSKQVQTHLRKLGLRRHVETAVDLVADYDSVLVLEDDLSVSPWMFHYCEQALAAYGEDPNIAQIALYSSDFNEFCGLPFTPLRDESDSWFSKVPCSWGQLWTRPQWQRYRQWQQSGEEGRHLEKIPAIARQWSVQSWKKSYFEYLASSSLWVVYPYTSLTTNHGDAGAHFTCSVRDLEVPLEIKRQDYRFKPFSDTRVRYDAWLEPPPEIIGDTPIDRSLITVDLYGSKKMADIKTPYLLSLKPCTQPINTYGTNLTPLELNVRLGAPGITHDLIYLGRIQDFRDGPILHGLFAARVKRRLQKQLCATSYSKGQADVRMELRYRLGHILLWLPSQLAGGFAKFATPRSKSHRAR